MKNINNELIQNLISIWLLESHNENDETYSVIKEYKENIIREWPQLANILYKICWEDSNNKMLEELIIKEVANKFSQHNMVSKIYYNEKNTSNAEYEFYVITSNNQYDDFVMGELLDIEWEINHIFEDSYLSISYHENPYIQLKLIYERK